MKRIIILILALVPVLSFAQNNLDNKLVGTHLFSLQWISWDYFGNAKITPTATPNEYKIEGIQKSKEHKGDYVKINGTLTAVNAKHLIFNGTVETKVHHSNYGQPCVRTGKFNFKATGNRKYWRLQEMENPCDGVTDYVDIFFKKRASKKQMKNRKTPQNDIEKTFSYLKWVDANAYENDVFRFGYAPKTFHLKKEKDPEHRYANKMTFLGTYKGLKFYFSPGGVGDPPIFIVFTTNGEDIREFSADNLCINSQGIIYTSKKVNKNLNIRRKFIIKGNEIEEVKQPYLYVGEKGKLLRTIKLYSSQDNQGQIVATLPKGYEVEVLLYEQEFLRDVDSTKIIKYYLVRTKFGLVGWLTTDSQEGLFIK